MTWIRLSRTLLPVLVLISKENLTPFFDRIPSEPLTQPASSSSFEAPAWSYLYLGLTFGLKAHETGE